MIHYLGDAVSTFWIWNLDCTGNRHAEDWGIYLEGIVSFLQALYSLNCFIFSFDPNWRTSRAFKAAHRLSPIALNAASLLNASYSSREIAEDFLYLKSGWNPYSSLNSRIPSWEFSGRAVFGGVVGGFGSVLPLFHFRNFRISADVPNFSTSPGFKTAL